MCLENCLLRKWSSSSYWRLELYGVAKSGTSRVGFKDKAPHPGRGWNLALAFQEVFTAIVRLRYSRQAVSNAEAFRAQIKHALRVAEQEARTGGYSADEVRQVIFAVVGFLDESALSCRNPAFSDWPRLPLQAELFGHQLAGEVFFQELQSTLGRQDSSRVADVLEVYLLCLLLGFKGRYAAGGDLRSIMATIRGKIQRVRGPSGALSPNAGDTVRHGTDGPVRSMGTETCHCSCCNLCVGIGDRTYL